MKFLIKSNIQHVTSVLSDQLIFLGSLAGSPEIDVGRLAQRNLTSQVLGYSAHMHLNPQS
jgi:hypothetical protein